MIQRFAAHHPTRVSSGSPTAAANFLATSWASSGVW
jgi:hypothetical protein